MNMARVVHFDIEADEPEKLIDFYKEIFGWNFQKWDGPMDYWLIMTGKEDEPGIDGGLGRKSPQTMAFNTIEISKQAVETRYWPLYEVLNGEYKLSYKPSKEVSVKEFLMLQRRFKHVDEKLMKFIQDRVNFKWKELLKLCGED